MCGTSWNFCRARLFSPIVRTPLVVRDWNLYQGIVAENTYNAAMVKLHKPRRLTIWIACFAILLNALAPSISYAMYAMHSTSSPSGTAPILMEVCTATGMKMVDDAAEKTSGSALDASGDHKKPVAASAHCPFCLPHAGSFALLPTGAIRFAVSAKHGLMPPLFYQSPHPLFSWAVAHSRAPPVAS